MVYDATKCGLNAAVSPPNFYMRTIDSCLRSMEPTTVTDDNDLGEIFLNYILHVSINAYVGIDVTECLLSPSDNPYETKEDYKAR